MDGSDTAVLGTQTSLSKEFDVSPLSWTHEEREGVTGGRLSCCVGGCKLENGIRESIIITNCTTHTSKHKHLKKGRCNCLLQYKCWGQKAYGQMTLLKVN